jgi:TPP-dependent pyruvate/acetoin dehydrogenase alpha subunit
VHGWDYVELINAYQKASEIARNEHVPVMIHVNELTQPQGHSTSGSHERYKTPERLKWEQSNDCNTKFREWIISNEVATDENITSIERDIKKRVKEGKIKAWKDFCAPIKTVLISLSILFFAYSGIMTSFKIHFSILFIKVSIYFAFLL